MNEMEDNPALVAAEKDRRRRLLWTAVLLLIGLPVYIWVASGVVAALIAPSEAPDGGRSVHWALELLIYFALGLVWAFPLKRLVQGLGKKPRP